MFVSFLSSAVDRSQDKAKPINATEHLLMDETVVITESSAENVVPLSAKRIRKRTQFRGSGMMILELFLFMIEANIH